MSCFRGRMREYKNISLDRFDGDNLRSTVFFLSHIHSDHTVGLKDSAFFEYLQSRTDVFIYCSEVTKLLLSKKSKYSHLDQYVKVLPVDEPKTVPIPQQASCKVDLVDVTLLHAGHCPGSVMFLFEGTEGVCLYTGDFRWDSQQISTIKALHSANNSIKQIDSLYIDTTFCHESSIYIPSREDSANATTSLVSEWLAKGDNYVVHFTPRAQYGHEHLLKEVYKKTGHKIHVFDKKYEIYRSIPGLEDVFTNDGSCTPIHACKGKWCSTGVPCGTSPEGCRVMVILPSTMYFTMIRNYDLGHIVIKNGFVHRVCYSFHSSYTEVKDFVTYLQPKLVRPNVKPAQDKNILKVQGRLNDFLKLKNSKALGNSQKVKPLGRLRRSKFRKRSMSENSSESLDLNFGTPEEYKPLPKKAKVEVHNDSEEGHSSYDGSLHSDSEMSDLCPLSDQELDVPSRPPSLSLPGQSLLAALDEQEFQMTQGSQPEILDGRVCLPDDEEQISAVVVPTNTLQSVDYDIVPCEKGDNSTELTLSNQQGVTVISSKVKGDDTLSSAGDSLITAAEEAEKEVQFRAFNLDNVITPVNSDGTDQPNKTAVNDVNMEELQNVTVLSSDNDSTSHSIGEDDDPNKVKTSMEHPVLLGSEVKVSDDHDEDLTLIMAGSEVKVSDDHDEDLTLIMAGSDVKVSDDLNEDPILIMAGSDVKVSDDLNEDPILINSSCSTVCGSQPSDTRVKEVCDKADKTVDSEDDDVIIGDIEFIDYTCTTENPTTGNVVDADHDNEDLSLNAESFTNCINSARALFTTLLNKQNNQNMTSGCGSVYTAISSVNCRTQMRPSGSRGINDTITSSGTSNGVCVILDSDEEEERSLLSGKKSLSRGSSFTQNNQADPAMIDNSLPHQTIQVLDGTCQNTAIVCDDYSDDETLPPSQHSDTSIETMSPFTTPVKSALHFSPRFLNLSDSTTSINNLQQRPSSSDRPGSPVSSRLRRKRKRPILVRRQPAIICPLTILPNARPHRKHAKNVSKIRQKMYINGVIDEDLVNNDSTEGTAEEEYDTESSSNDTTDTDDNGEDEIDKMVRRFNANNKRLVV